MPRSAPIQPSFAGGVVSPRLRGRVDSDLYRKALQQCDDAEPTPHGSLCRRPGSMFVAGLDSGAVRLIPLRMADEQDYILVLTDGAMRVYSVDGGVLIDNPGSLQELIVNGDFSAGLTGWTVYGSVTSTGGAAVMASAPTSQIMQQVTLTEERDLVLSLDLVAIGTKDVTVVVSSPMGLSTIFHVWSTISPADGPGTYRWTCHLGPGTYSVYAYVHNGTATIDNVSFGYSLAGGSSGYSVPTPWGNDDLAGLAYAADSAASTLYVVSPSAQPYYIQRSRAGSWSVQPITFAGAPTEWADGNWPSVVEVYQSRLWLAATRLQANTIWSSRTGNPFDFNYRTEEPPASGTYQTLGTDGIVAPVATKGAIRWMRGRQMLLFGTDLGEHALVASQGVLTPTDLQVRAESAFGAQRGMATDLGDQVLYVSGDGRKVRSIDYSRETDSWRSRDVTWIAEHLTAAGVTEVHHAPSPNGTMVLHLADGTLACCTLDRAEEVAAWWPAALPGASILSAAVSNGPAGSVLFLAVQRGAATSLEAIAMDEHHPDRVYLDAAAVADISAVTLVDDLAQVAGFDHLEGQVVETVIDGEYQGSQTVVGGEVTIERTGSLLTVGLPYTSRAVTLPPEGGNPGGTAQGSKRRRPKIVLRLNASALPLVNGRRAADRHPATGMDTPEAPWTGDVELWDRGWDTDGQVTLEFDLPFRTEVLAIFGELQVNG